MNNRQQGDVTAMRAAAAAAVGDCAPVPKGASQIQEQMGALQEVVDQLDKKLNELHTVMEPVLYGGMRPEAKTLDGPAKEPLCAHAEALKTFTDDLVRMRYRIDTLLRTIQI